MQRRTNQRRGTMAAGVLALALACLGAPAAGAPEDEPRAVPNILNLRAMSAKERLEAAGFVLGRVYEVSWQRILDSYGVRHPIGNVVFQMPPADGRTWRPGRAVHVVLCARRDGDVPPDLPGLKPARPPAAPVPDAPAPPEPPPPPADEPPADEPAPPDEPPATPVPPPATPSRPAPDPELAEGSPDAPRVAPPADPEVVPSIIGLSLAEAEMLVRDAKMKLYVERVAGHPIGRVLEQEPPPHAARPAGDIVRVVVTAGGDFEGETAGPPEVYVPEMVVPNLLDRTELQAERIVGDLGLVIQKEVAKRGLAGLVVDQKPAEGGRVSKGGIVHVWIGPKDPSAPAPAPDAPPPPGPPAPAEPPAGDAPSEGGGAADPNQPLAPGPLPGAAPEPVAPRHGAVIPRDESVPVGFTWRAVKRASSYVLEVEEEGVGGRWLPNVRKPSRKTAAILEIERISTKPGARLRWRVRALVDGREGPPCRWVVLK